VKPEQLIKFPWEKGIFIKDKKGISQGQLDSMMRFIAK